MSSGYLKLVLGNLNVTLRQFSGEEFPRAKVEPVKSDRSIWGTFISYGRYFEEGHVWNCTAIVSPEEQEILEAIYWQHHQLRRTFQPAQVLLIDTTLRFQEAAPRTRAIAPAPFNEERAIAGGSHVSYFAQFYVWFDAQPTYSKLGIRHYSANLSLIEFAGKPAP